LLGEDEQQRIRVVVEPYLDADVLEKVSVAGHELYLAVGELYYLVVGAVY